MGRNLRKGAPIPKKAPGETVVEGHPPAHDSAKRLAVYCGPLDAAAVPAHRQHTAATRRVRDFVERVVENDAVVATATREGLRRRQYATVNQNEIRTDDIGPSLHRVMNGAERIRGSDAGVTGRVDQERNRKPAIRLEPTPRAGARVLEGVDDLERVRGRQTVDQFRVGDPPRPAELGQCSLSVERPRAAVVDQLLPLGIEDGDTVSEIADEQRSILIVANDPKLAHRHPDRAQAPVDSVARKKKNTLRNRESRGTEDPLFTAAGLSPKLGDDDVAERAVTHENVLDLDRVQRDNRPAGLLDHPYFGDRTHDHEIRSPGQRFDVLKHEGARMRKNRTQMRKACEHGSGPQSSSSLASRHLGDWTRARAVPSPELATAAIEETKFRPGRASAPRHFHSLPHFTTPLRRNLARDPARQAAKQVLDRPATNPAPALRTHTRDPSREPMRAASPRALARASAGDYRG